jgi:hypothetical protein
MGAGTSVSLYGIGRGSRIAGRGFFLKSVTIHRIAIAAALAGLLACPTPATAQNAAPQPRRQFLTVSYDWLYTWPLHFDKFPLEDIVGMPIGSAEEPYDYRTDDGRTSIDVVQFKRRNRAVGAAVYPFGLSSGATLGIRGSIEQLPEIRVRFDGPSPIASYDFTGGVAYDVGAGVYVADRSAGWGVGSYSFLIGGIGRISSDLGNGRRYFAEGGGGLQSGPFGFELSVKFGWNRLNEPIEHRFFTVPINMRATVSF